MLVSSVGAVWASAVVSAVVAAVVGAASFFAFAAAVTVRASLPEPSMPTCFEASRGGRAVKAGVVLQESMVSDTGKYFCKNQMKESGLQNGRPP